MSEVSKKLNELVTNRYGTGIDLNDGEVPGADTLASILAHRTHRRYADKPVDDATVKLLLACAFSTPAKSDLQQCSVIVVRDPDRRAKLAELIPSMPWIAAAPVFMVFCGDSRRIRKTCEVRGKPFANDHLDAFLNAAADAAMHMSTFITAADAMGLGTCGISVLRNNVEQVCEILELPAGVFPFAGCCLGWPEREGFISVRLSLDMTVHEDRYDDDKFESLLDEYDNRRDAAFSIPRENQRHTEEYGEAEFYGWSEDKARQVSKPEREKLGAFLRGHGFKFD